MTQPGLGDYDLLIADSSVLFRFFEAGAECTRKLLDHCGERLYIVQDVSEEIDRYRDDSAMKDGIAIFDQDLKNAPIQLPSEVTEQVADILVLNRKYGLGDEDEGETATVLYAAWAWDESGREFLVLMGDKWGRNLAEDKDVPIIDTIGVLVDLVCQSALSPSEGELVWQSIFSKNADLEAYYAKLTKMCPRVLE